MISRFDLEQYCRHSANAPFYIEGDEVFDVETRQRLTTVEDFLERCRRKEHCDFETVYYCHGTLEHVLRCRECGTVVFASDDCSYYEDALCCPHCSDYKTGFEWWSGSDIERDANKREVIQQLERMQQEQDEAAERFMRRNLHDWQIKKYYKEFKKHAVSVEFNAENYIKSGLKGLYVEITIWERGGDLGVGVLKWKRSIEIPLSWSRFKYHIKWLWYKRKEKQDASKVDE